MERPICFHCGDHCNKLGSDQSWSRKYYDLLKEHDIITLNQFEQHFIKTLNINRIKLSEITNV